jgi:hypothetical protein
MNEKSGWDPWPVRISEGGEAAGQKLLASSQMIYGSLDSVELLDADFKRGAF